METQLRIGNEVTDFLPKPGSLSSPSMTTFHTLFFFFILRSFVCLQEKLLKHGKEKCKSGPCEDLTKPIKHNGHEHIRGIYFVFCRLLPTTTVGSV